jgi:ATP-dependent Lhr-like helicase
MSLRTGAKGQGASGMSVGTGVELDATGQPATVARGPATGGAGRGGVGLGGDVTGSDTTGVRESDASGLAGDVPGAEADIGPAIGVPSEPIAPELTPAEGAALLASLGPSGTARAAALARVLLERYGVLTREAVHAEDIAGGFSAVYAVLGAMEQAGKIRRGYFVAGLGGAQFALAGADERLRALREPGESPEICVLATTDPCNPYGAALPWPERPGTRLARAAHTRVVLVDGALAAYLTRDARSVWTFLPEEEPERSQMTAALARALAGLVGGQRRTLVLGQIDGVDAQVSPLAPALERAGFAMTSQGLFIRAHDEN